MAEWKDNVVLKVIDHALNTKDYNEMNLKIPILSYSDTFLTYRGNFGKIDFVV